MAIDTTDVRTHGDKQIIRAADFLSGSEDRQLVFEEIYRGKSSGKTAKEIAFNLYTLKIRSEISAKRVLDVTRALRRAKLIQSNKSKGVLTFIKVDFFSLYKRKILRLARDTNALERFRIKVFGHSANMPSRARIKKANIPRPKPKIITKVVKGSVAMEKTTDTWDVFICHASEDKDSIARPLKNALTEAGLKVWFDESALKLGDRLHKAIDTGIAKSGYGIVILSEAFFKKDWPQRELEALVAKEYEGQKVILPVWHNIDAAFVRSKSLLLAGLVGVETSKGIDYIVKKVLEVIRPKGTKITAPKPVIELPKEEESIKSILEGTIRSLQPLEEATIMQTIKQMDFDILKKTYTDLLDAVALFDVSSYENKNVFIFLKEAVLERIRSEGIELFEILLKWYFETAAPRCKYDILKILASLTRLKGFKEIASRKDRVGVFVAEFGRSNSYDVAGVNSQILQNIKYSLSSNDCTRIVDYAIANSQIYESNSAQEYLFKILPYCKDKVDRRKLEKLYDLLM